MKTLFFVLLFVFCTIRFAFSGTCSSISRTNVSSGAILTSSKYNADHNISYAAINSLDGGCVANGTLEKVSLNTTDFAVPLKGIKRGCGLLREGQSSLSIDECFASVNGNYVTTTSTTAVSWSDLDTGSEATGTAYHVYIKTGSTGSTLTPKISATAPGTDGYNTEGDFAIGRFWNDQNGNIATGSIYQFETAGYHNNDFVTEQFRVAPNGKMEFQSGGFFRECFAVSTGVVECQTEVNYAACNDVCWSCTMGIEESLESIYRMSRGSSGDNTFSIITGSNISSPGGPGQDPSHFNFVCTIKLRR